MTTDMGGGTGTRATEATEALDGFTAFAEATLLVSLAISFGSPALLVSGGGSVMLHAAHVDATNQTSHDHT